MDLTSKAASAGIDWNITDFVEEDISLCRFPRNNIYYILVI